MIYSDKIKNAKMIEIIMDLETCLDKNERKEGIEEYLCFNEINFENQKYKTGQNIIATIGNPPYIGVGSHYDVVPRSPGANDNASAVAVTIDVLRRFQKYPLKNIGVKGFFFDQEEDDLIGSKAYVDKNGIEGLIGVYNMELVGVNDIAALWTVAINQKGTLLEEIENTGKKINIPIVRIPMMIANAADHISFNEAGLVDAFTITMIPKEDLSRIPEYLQALKNNCSMEELWKIMSTAKVFEHYHKPSDKSEHLSQKTLENVSQLLYDSIREIDKKYS